MSVQKKSAFKSAIDSDDLPAIDHLLTEHAELADAVNDPVFAYRQPALAAAKSVAAAKLLIRHGARLQPVGDWWRPGFLWVSNVDSDVARFLVGEGAELSPHAAAAMGMAEELEEFLQIDSGIVHAPGGDGCTPLHFAKDVRTASLLIEAGAKLDATDDDHDSTPVQWLIGDHPDVARFLIDQGAAPDIFVAAALGIRAMVERLVADNTACLTYRVGKLPYPPIGHEGKGGTILQWSLGFNSYAHQYAAKNGHHELFQFMFDRSDDTTKFLVACLTAKRELAQELVDKVPEIVQSLDEEDKQLFAKYCWETNKSYKAVELMLDLGFQVDYPESRHGNTPLHNAAWGGYSDLVDLLIARGHPVDVRDPEYDSTPLGWAIHCCVNDGRHPEGDYGGVVAALIDAGCPWDESIYPTGVSRIDDELKARLGKPAE